MAPLNSTNPTSTIRATAVTTRDPNELTEEELEKQKLFLILVVTCFFSFLFFVISYVTFTHVKRIKSLQKQQKKEAEEEEDDKPIINSRTAVMGQGQKQVVIERKASVISRKQSGLSSSSNGNQNNGPQLNTNLLRHSWLKPPDQLPPYYQTSQPMRGQRPRMSSMINQPTHQKDVMNEHTVKGNNYLPEIPPTLSPTRIQNRYTFPNNFPVNNYLENVLIRYRGDDFKEEPSEKSTTDETESASSSSDSLTGRRKDAEAGEGASLSDALLERESDGVESEGLSGPSFSFTTEESRLLTP